MTWFSDYYSRYNANIHRGLHTLADEATAAFEAMRHRVKAFLNAEDARQIIFTRGTTEAINLVAQSWGRSQLNAGDEVLISMLEHHSNIVPWQLLAAERGALRRLPRPLGRRRLGRLLRRTEHREVTRFGSSREVVGLTNNGQPFSNLAGLDSADGKTVLNCLSGDGVFHHKSSIKCQLTGRKQSFLTA